MKDLIALAFAALAVTVSAGVANAQGTWSSIALDMAGNYNLVTGAASEEAANQQALDGCDGADCYSVFATESSCMSIADTPEGNYQYGWAYGNTEEGVRMIALGYCIESGYSGCKTLVSQCVASGEVETVGPGPGPKTKTKG